MEKPFTLPFIPPSWTPVTRPDISLTSTATAIAGVTTTSATPGAEPLSNSAMWTMGSLESMLHLLLYLSVPLMYSLTQQRRRAMACDAETRAETAQEWAAAWCTKDWSTLYGLVALAQQNEAMPTPFVPSVLHTIQQRLQSPRRRRRRALRQLLQKGIIPLYMQDGGVTTEQTACWRLGASSSFPYVALPRYRQSKSRAFFDVLIPHCDDELVKHFVGHLCNNEEGYGVEYCRFYPPTGRRRGGVGKPPCAPYRGPAFPLSVGAESVVESWLPFCRDRVLEKAHEGGTGGCCPLDWYLTGDGSRSVPLLHYVSSCVVRIEAGHWGHVELDDCVLECAQDVGMEDRWPLNEAQRNATRELESFGLAMDEI